MGVLARSGFSYDLAKEILALDLKQLKNIRKKTLIIFFVFLFFHFQLIH